jgi:EpsI family protein
MQKAPILAVIAAAMSLSAFTANHAFGRLQAMKPRVLPVESFPRQIGDWTAGDDVPVEPRVQGFLPTARIVDRRYVNSTGQAVSCMLITASDILDFHNPNICLPGNGWELSEQRTLYVGKQSINSMVGTRDGETANVRYWFVGDTAGTVPGSITLTKVFAIRRLLTNEHVSSLLVRLIAPHNSSGDAAIQAFTREIQPYLTAVARK